MASKKKVVNMSLLAGIAAGTITHVSQVDGLPLLQNDPPLIEVNTNMVDGSGNAAVRLTDAGKALLPNGSAAKNGLASAETPVYSIISGAVLPPRKKRGGKGGGAPTQYPWATLEVGQSFFVPVSADKLDPVKSMTSAVSSANMKYSEPTGETHMVTRTVRGPKNKAVVDAAGAKVKETVERPKMRPVRKFELSAVTKGTAYGNWTAEADGALIARVI